MVGMQAVTEDARAALHFLPGIRTRLARDDEGNRVRELAESVGFKADLDWDRVYPYWLVAIEFGEIVGTIQVCPGLPVGRLEVLAIDPSLRERHRKLLVRHLLVAGLHTLKALGAGAAIGAIPDEMGDYLEWLEGKGAVVIEQATLVMMEIEK